MKNNKLVWVIIAAMTLNVLLGYGMFWQWRSRNVQFMDNYQRLHGDIMLTSGHLARYLESGNYTDLELARSYHKKVYERSNLFNSYYYYDSLGNELTRHLFHLFDPLLLSNPDNTDFITEYHAGLERLVEALTIEDEDWIWTTSPIPRHPINRKFSRNLLNELSEIREPLK